MVAFKKMSNNIAKTLLKNHIRHADTHNRMVEEKDMWKEYHKMKEFENESKYSFLHDKRTDMGNEFPSHRNKRAHMDDEPQTNQSTVCLRKLFKAEANDPDRWGHSGYKELYPKDFDSDRSDEEKRSKKKVKKWDHSGFEKLYPEDFDSDRSDEGKRSKKKVKLKKKSKKVKKRKKKKKTKHEESGYEMEQRKRKHLRNDSSKSRTSESESEPDYKLTKKKHSKSDYKVKKMKSHKHLENKTEQEDSGEDIKCRKKKYSGNDSSESDSESEPECKKQKHSESDFKVKRKKSHKHHKKKKKRKYSDSESESAIESNRYYNQDNNNCFDNLRKDHVEKVFYTKSMVQHYNKYRNYSSSETYSD